jgi:hypothetical protein
MDIQLVAHLGEEGRPHCQRGRGKYLLLTRHRRPRKGRPRWVTQDEFTNARVAANAAAFPSCDSSQLRPFGSLDVASVRFRRFALLSFEGPCRSESIHLWYCLGKLHLRSHENRNILLVTDRR